jgi:hypothetical protein
MKMDHIKIFSRRAYTIHRYKNLRRKLPNCCAGIYFSMTISHKSIRSEIPGKFWSVVLEKDGEDQLERSCEK